MDPIRHNMKVQRYNEIILTRQLLEDTTTDITANGTLKFQK